MNLAGAPAFDESNHLQQSRREDAVAAQHGAATMLGTFARTGHVLLGLELASSPHRPGLRSPSLTVRLKRTAPGVWCGTFGTQTAAPLAHRADVDGGNRMG